VFCPFCGEELEEEEVVRDPCCQILIGTCKEGHRWRIIFDELEQMYTLEQLEEEKT